MLYDISVPLENGMPVWPGDPGIRLEQRSHPGRDGAHTVRVTAIECGNHTGTHLDAPSHMLEGGRTLSQIPLEQMIGPARVLDLPGIAAIGRRELERQDLEGVERVLFKTDNSTHWTGEGFHAGFTYLEPDGARCLVEHGVHLVGIDYLSIDRYGSAEHPSHMVLLGESVVILEGLNLSGVPAGDYQLVALPLKLEGADGAPVRAVLMS